MKKLKHLAYIGWLYLRQQESQQAQLQGSIPSLLQTIAQPLYQQPVPQIQYQLVQQVQPVPVPLAQPVPQLQVPMTQLPQQLHPVQPQKPQQALGKGVEEVGGYDLSQTDCSDIELPF